MRKKDTYKFYPPIIDGSHIPIGSSYIISESFRTTYNVKRIYLDIIGFFALHGPNPVLAMTEGPIKPRKRGRPPKYKILREPKRNQEQTINYNYKTALRHAKKLESMGLLKRIKPKGKELFALTFLGFHVHMRDPNRNPENLEATIKSNYRLLPFSQFWNELIEIAGEQFVYECLAKAISEKIYKEQFRIEDLDLIIDLLYIHPKHKPAFQVREDKKVKELLELLSTAVTLGNSYVYYLAAHDILFLIEQKKWPKTTNDLINFESEKALAFFEKRSIHEKPLFIPGKQLIKFLKSYYKLRFFFTGMFIDKLLSRSNRQTKFIEPSKERVLKRKNSLIK